MDYLNFALGYFALLAGSLFFATAYAHLTGSLFGIPHQKLLMVALSFGATHAVISVASLLVPPAQPVMVALLTLGIMFMSVTFLFRFRKMPNHANFTWLVGNIFAVSGVSFEASHRFSEAAIFLPLALIVLTSIIIALTAFALPAKPMTPAT